MEWLRTILEAAKINEGVLDIEGIMSTVKTEFPKHAVPKSDYNDKAGELKEANDTITTIKKENEDNETLQKTIKDHEATITTLQKEKENTRRNIVLQTALKESGCTDPDYLIYKQGGIEKFTFDKDGTPVGVEDIIKPYKETNKMLFPTGQQQQQYNPTGGASGNASNPFAEETWNVTKQGELFKENPAQAKELASAAGITI